MSNKKANHVIVLDPAAESVKELLPMLEQKNNAEVIHAANPEEAAQLVLQYTPCMVISSIADNTSIPKTINLLKKIESGIKKGMLKTLVISKQKNRQLGQLITGLGVTDYIEEPIPVRTLYFKSNLQLKAVETIRKQEEMKKAAQEQVVFKKDSQKKEGDASVSSPDGQKSKQVPALQVEEDTFLFKGSQPKKQGKKILLEVEGPSPETGEWVQHENKEEAQSAWRWVPEEEKETPEAKRGDGWVYSGDKPVFKAETQKWQLQSEKPELALVENGKKIAKKVETNPSGELAIAQDSARAEENIKASKKIAEKIQSEKAASAANLSLKTKLEQPKLVNDIKLKAEKKEGSAENLEFKAEKEVGPQSVADLTLEKEEGPQVFGEVKIKDESIGHKQEKEPPKGEEKLKDLSKLVQKLGKNTLPEDEEKNSSAEEEIKLTGADKKEKNSPLDFLTKKKKEKQTAEKITETAASENEETVEAVFGKKSKKEDEPGAEVKSIGKKSENKKTSLAGLKNLLDKSQKIEEKTESSLDEVAAESDASEFLEEDPLSLAEQKKGKAQKTIVEPELESSADKKRLEKIGLAKEKIASKKKALESALANLEEDTHTNDDTSNTTGLIGEAKEKTQKKKADLQAKIKELEDKLGDLDSMEGEARKEPGFSVHDLKEDDPENTWSQKNLEVGAAKKNKIRAFDSEEKAEDESEERLKGKAKKKSSDKKAEIEERYFFLPEKDIKPVGAAWVRAGDYFVFISGDTQYHGFKSLESLLPLWVYKGHKAPELLSKSREWQFLDREALPIKLEKYIPADVKDFLLKINERVKKEKAAAEGEKESLVIGKESQEEESAESPATNSVIGKRKEAQKAKTELEDEIIADPKREKEAKLDKEEETVAAKKEKKKLGSELEDKLAQMKRSLEDSAEILDEEKTKDNSEENIEAGERKHSGKKTASGKGELLAAESDLEESTFAEESETEDLNDGTSNRRSKEKKTKDSALAAQDDSEGDEKTHAKRTGKITEEDSPAKPNSASIEEEQEDTLTKKSEGKLIDLSEEKEKKQAQAVELQEEETKKTKDAGSVEVSTGTLAKKLEAEYAAESDSLKNFFARRKNKTPGKRDKVAKKPDNAYLAISVSLSDALYSGKGLTKTGPKLMQTIAESIGNCEVFVMDGEKNILVSSGTVESEMHGTSLQFPIKQLGRAEALGMLCVQPKGERAEFNESEQNALAKAASLLVPLILKDHEMRSAA